MSWDESGFEVGAQWHMTPDGQWHTGPSPGPGAVTGHVVKVDPWGVTIADGPPPPALVEVPAPPGASRAPNRRERRAAAARAR